MSRWGTRLLTLALFLLLLPAGMVAQDDGSNLVIEPKPIKLLQPFSNSLTEVSPQAGIDTFFAYFNAAWPFLIGTAAGIAVLQVLVAGVQIMISKGQEQKTAGEERLMWAIAGLIMLILAGFILRTLNPLFYI